MVIIYLVLDMHPFGISKTISGLSLIVLFFHAQITHKYHKKIGQ